MTSSPAPKTPATLLLSPLRLNQLTLKNRVVVSPMCMYSAQEARPTIFIWFIWAASRWAARA